MKVISVEHLSKTYRLGQIGTGTFSRDLEVWWAKMRGKPNPLLRIGEKDHGNRNGEELWALRDVSFTVQQGEVLGIIGRNGAGKSTLLKILSRVTAPTSGKVKVKGRVASLLEVGTGFHPELTGRENIYLNGAILGMKKAEIERKFDEIVDFSGVEKFIDTPVKRYSSGMYVRLAFAVAAHLDPEILLVDEVLAVGDAEFQKKCLGKMGEVAKEGRTVLFVSHNMGAIRQLCTHVILFESGMLQKSGTANSVVNAYLSNKDYVTDGEYVWEDVDMPGDESARIKAIRLRAENGEIRTVFGTTEPVNIEVEYRLFDKTYHFRVGVSLFTSDGTYVLYSSDADLPEIFALARPPGDHLSRCQIPAGLLNEGSYFITIGGGLYGVRTIFKELPDLQFTIVSTGGGTNAFPEKRPGIVAPELAWQVSFIEQEMSGRKL